MLGSLLKQKREELKLTLEDAEKGTNIRKLYIEALENEEYHKLPKAEIFCKGFLRSYSKFLGLNDEELVEIYVQEKNNLPPANKDEEQVVEPAPEEIAEQEVEVQQEVKVAPSKPKEQIKRTKLSDFASHQQYMERKPINRKKLVMVVGLVIVILIGLVSLISSLGKSKNEPAPVKENTQVEQVQTAPIILTAKFTGDAQVKVLVDGNVVLDKNITKGSELKWEAKQSLSIITSKPEAVMVSLNKEAEHILAQGSQPTEVIFALNDQKQIITTVNVEAKKAEEPKPEPEEKVEKPAVKQEVKQEVKKPAPPKPEPKPVAKEAAKPAPAPAPKGEQPQPKAE